MPYLIYTFHVIVANSYPVLVLIEEVNCIDWIDRYCIRSLPNIHDSCWATEGHYNSINVVLTEDNSINVVLTEDNNINLVLTEDNSMNVVLTKKTE